MSLGARQTLKSFLKDLLSSIIKGTSFPFCCSFSSIHEMSMNFVKATRCCLFIATCSIKKAKS